MQHSHDAFDVPEEKPYIGFFCESCEQWYHSFCEHITVKALKLVRRYVCTAKTKGSLLIQLGVSQLQVHYQKMCIQAHYLPNIIPLWLL